MGKLFGDRQYQSFLLFDVVASPFDGLCTVTRIVSYQGNVLMDLQMPVLGGLDAARRIRESIHPQAASIPIIALTANAFEEDRREALEAGMNGFVPKPIDFAVLAKEIGRVRREGRCLRLLLAEDNELNREIAAELIRADGQQVDAVENGHQALEAYLNAPDGCAFSYVTLWSFGSCPIS